MARKMYVLKEILTMLGLMGASKSLIDKFEKQAIFVADNKSEREFDEVTVRSGFGQMSQKGFVELTMNDQLSQMDVKKAREIGLMLIEAAEAATSDEMTVKLLDDVGIDANGKSQILLKLREIRQGTRGTSWVS